MHPTITALNKATAVKDMTAAAGKGLLPQSVQHYLDITVWRIHWENPRNGNKIS
jgi:hypothetical protein